VPHPYRHTRSKLGNLARPQDKQEALVEFITETRCRFLRLLAVIQWSGKAPLIEACTARLAAFEQHAQVFMATADWLHYQKRELHECCLPLCVAETWRLLSYHGMLTQHSLNTRQVSGAGGGGCAYNGDVFVSAAVRGKHRACAGAVNRRGPGRCCLA
jgi:hypothetical protein